MDRKDTINYLSNFQQSMKMMNYNLLTVSRTSIVKLRSILNKSTITTRLEISLRYENCVQVQEEMRLMS